MSVIKFSPSEMRATLEYWSPARIAAATPFSLPQAKITEERLQKHDAFSKAETEMSFCGAIPDSIGTSTNAFIDSIGTSTKTIRLMNLKNKILKKVGRLYYLRADNQFGWATAQFVGYDNVIMTAAHCVQDLSDPSLRPAKYLMFMKSFQNGTYKQAMPIIVSSITVPPAWTPNLKGLNRVKWDYAFMQTLHSTKTGYFELGMHIPYHAKSIGYPNIYQYKYLAYVNCSTGEIIDGKVFMPGNYMGQGANGGAWLSWKEESNQIFSLNSQSNGSGTMYGPVFNQETQNLLNHAFFGCTIS